MSTQQNTSFELCRTCRLASKTPRDWDPANLNALAIVSVSDILSILGILVFLLIPNTLSILGCLGILSVLSILATVDILNTYVS